MVWLASNSIKGWGRLPTLKLGCSKWGGTSLARLDRCLHLCVCESAAMNRHPPRRFSPTEVWPAYDARLTLLSSHSYKVVFSFLIYWRYQFDYGDAYSSPDVLSIWPFIRCCVSLSRKINEYMCMQGGRSWHPFGEGKNDHKNVRQACIYFFRDKCVVYARNYKLHFFCPKISKNCVNRDKF